ncbi:MAG: DMT family transporter [Cyanobacteriota bacterium]|nr:DMT family transporter [Cyanobacteriota bacterium]
MIDLNSIGLVGYVVVTGLRSTVLKGLQIQGSANPIGGENPISFCNVFLVSQLMIGLALILSEPRRTWAQMGLLSRTQRIQLATDAFFGCFLAPMAFFLALDKLTVISQTLLFALTLPASALLARTWLKERLPERFWWSLGLITTGLLVGRLFRPMALGHPEMMDQLTGVLWALVSVGATALRNCIRRTMAGHTLCRGLSVGIPNLAGALVFAVIALQQYGPQHFFYLRLWWVMGVIVIYGLTLCLGAEVLRQFSQRHYTVGQLGLASSTSLVVTVLTAALLLREPFQPATLASMVLILLGVSLRYLWPKPQVA